MQEKKLSNCPTCKSEINEKLKGIFPFCTKRCKMIDFGKWTEGQYSIPVQNLDEEDLEQLTEAIESAANE